ncbi:hypothetical protein H310_05522 [Aphanomyces invadans]|uniref:Uncharacterized protein n=1 Tax=Aphanomyces invadans TaxID=157072 RepID=A0A024U9I7_9STRA|nr:hypothetical protein H310_05522 [Aphanomyces invadans]ETW03096.1 hypothetical protein H310_05522 [Aphanomyces invadans]|eukprot:XP_008868480.1 hypothetical protein H310_05522 [Aphanomyces invadans]
MRLGHPELRSPRALPTSVPLIRQEDLDSMKTSGVVIWPGGIHEDDVVVNEERQDVPRDSPGMRDG